MFHVYGFCILIGIVCALLFLYCDTKRVLGFGFSFDEILDFTMIGLTGAIIGARLWFLIIDFKYNSGANWWNISEGLSLLGGLFGGFLSLIIYSHMIKINVLSVFNLAYPYIPLVNAFGRIGCFWALCCGPYQLISAMYYFILFLVFYINRFRFDKKSSPYLYYILVVFGERLLFDPFREDAYWIIKYVTYYQLISGFMIIGIYFWFFGRHFNKR